MKSITTQYQTLTNGLGIATGIYTYPVNSPTLVDAFKPKRAGKNPKLAHVVFLLDDSASMQFCRSVTISGFNEYLASQKADAITTGIKTVVSLYKFNGKSVTCVFDQQDVNTVEPLTTATYNPNGFTNLLDAVGGVLMKINTILAEKAKAERESVIINILTDGQENASTTFNNSTIKAMVEKAQHKNWGFIFLGANIDAFSTGYALGFGSQNTMQFNTTNTDATMRAASRMTNSLKAAYATGSSTELAYNSSAFTDIERSLSVGDKNE